MRGEDDGWFIDGLDLFDRPYAEVFHLSDNSFVVNDLPENCTSPPFSGEALYLKVCYSDSGAEAVFCCALDEQTRCPLHALQPVSSAKTLHGGAAGM